MNDALQAAMWAGDVDELERLAPCGCCCHEHTHHRCDAREWGGCRSGLGPGESLEGEARAWQCWYAEHRGMSEEVFYGG